jgi:pimeloyl-ACP methyl ester carboxylesterase
MTEGAGERKLRSMTTTTHHHPKAHRTPERDTWHAFETAERKLMAELGVAARNRRLLLADPAVTARVLETGEGEPVVLVHGSGMSAPTWGPLLAELADRRVYAVDLPGFGLSDPYDYSGRALREHAVAQLTSLLDALELDRPVIAGTSLGAMWTLSLAIARPERVARVVALGVPAVSLPGMKGDPYFRAMTTPGVRRIVSRLPAPRNAKATRRAMARVLGARALGNASDTYFDVVRATMAMPGWRLAMTSHLELAMRRGRARPENAIGDDELRALEVPVHFVMGDSDVYGPPAVAERAAALMPAATVTTIPGGHAPFLDDPACCAAAIRG